MCYDLPTTKILRLWEPSHSEGECVEFRLIYKGRLHAESRKDSRAKEKQGIRKQIHKQLKELWHTHPIMSDHTKPSEIFDGSRPRIDAIADNYQRCGYRFVPLIGKDSLATCSLNILFLRRDQPGNLIHSGGDIDNRLKVLMDGLKMPSRKDELGGLEPEEGEDPFFCLIEDDSLITEIHITTDRLLLPRDGDEGETDVQLIIHVSTR